MSQNGLLNMTDLRSGLISFTSQRLICSNIVRLFSLVATGGYFKTENVDNYFD